MRESCDSKPASNCSASNRRILQHLRPWHFLKAYTSSHYILLFLSLFLSPFLSSPLQFSNGSSFPFAEGTALLQKKERGQRIKQTNTKLPKAMLNRGTHGTLFIFSIAIAMRIATSSSLVSSLFLLWSLGSVARRSCFRSLQIEVTFLPFN